MTEIIQLKSIAFFNGFGIGNITAGDAPDVDQIVFLSNQNKFAASYTSQVPNSSQAYYTQWDGSDDFYDGNNNIRQDILFKNTVNNELYHWTGTSLKLVGGIIDVDDVTLSHDEGVAKIADNAKDITNTIGDVQVTGSTMPALPQEATRYNIYKDIVTGNASGGTAITLPAGSKIVPHGGMPKIPVSGGETSWVHSSDIGMVQDDTSLTTNQRLTRGAANAEILRNFAKCPYNLILDGTYVIDIPKLSNVAHVDQGVRLERPLEIQGGKLIMTNYLFSMGEGSSLTATNVEFEHWKTNGSDRTGAYAMFYFDCRSNLIDHFIMRGCKFGGVGYVGYFADSISDNLLSTQSVNEINKWWYNKNNLSFIDYGCVQYKVNGSNVYGWIFPVGYNNEDGPVKDNNGNTVSESAYDNHCIYKVNGWGSIYVADSDTDFWENNVKDTSATYWFDTSTSTTNVLSGDVFYNGVWGKFLEVDENTPSSAATYHKALVARGAEWQGIGRFVLTDCVIDGAGKFQMSNMTIKEEFTVDHCTVYNLHGVAISFDSDNTKETSEDWTYRSCPLYVTNNTFAGPKEVVKDGSSYYFCSVLAETEEMYFRHNVIRDIMAASSYYHCYDAYVSCHRYHFEDNHVINVFALPRAGYAMQNSTWGKSKGIGGTIDWKKANNDGEHYDAVARIFRNNTFEINCGEAWDICKEHMESTFTGAGEDPFDIFQHYALRVDLMSVTTSRPIDRLIWEGNTLRNPMGFLEGNIASSYSNLAREFSFCDNILDFYGYCSIPFNKAYYSTNIYQRYLFVVNPCETGYGETRIRIDNNVFRSRSNEEIMLLCTKTDNLASHMSISCNRFENCYFRAIGEKGHNNDNVYYAGDLNAKHLEIKDNVCSSVVDEGIKAEEYSKSSSYYRGLTKADYTYAWTTESHEIEIFDTQNPGEPATAAKGIKVTPTSYGGKAAFRCRHICRPCTIIDGAIVNADPNRDLSLKLATVFHAEVGATLKGAWDIRIRYKKNGLDCVKKMELTATTNRTDASASNSTVVLRDTEGVRHGGYGNAAGDRVDANIACAPEIGLYAHLKYSPHVSWENGTRVEVSFYTDANGTTNDFGSDIIIEMIETSNAETVNTSTLEVGGTVSPIESFIPKGSVVSSTWREKKNILTNGTTTVNSQSILAPSDAGFWVLDDSTYNIMVWDGSNWQSIGSANI